ncbi:hypothetical protein OEZ85_008087 [Tetradesmus obliquus]|uniref:Uncharacterized protein n=1 Tax=Tetradesmus obliquus TaxID=3088 RepID=A0ABY8TI53_TETOB|nr:hypothetical protein OEZ85_008087 [Tetradesmus obliquus]
MTSRQANPAKPSHAKPPSPSLLLQPQRYQVCRRLLPSSVSTGVPPSSFPSLPKPSRSTQPGAKQQRSPLPFTAGAGA